MAPFSTRREGIDDDGIKGATSPTVCGMFNSSFSSLSFAISVNLYHPSPSLFLYGLLLSL